MRTKRNDQSVLLNIHCIYICENTIFFLKKRSKLLHSVLLLDVKAVRDKQAKSAGARSSWHSQDALEPLA